MSTPRTRTFTTIRREPERQPLRPTVASLRQIRIDRGISIRHLAAISGYDRSVLGRIEAGRIRPRVDQIEDIAAALGASVVLA